MITIAEIVTATAMADLLRIETIVLTETEEGSVTEIEASIGGGKMTAVKTETGDEMNQNEIGTGIEIDVATTIEGGKIAQEATATNASVTWAQSTAAAAIEIGSTVIEAIYHSKLPTPHARSKLFPCSKTTVL